METRSTTMRGRGRAGDRLRKRAATISAVGVRGEGSRLQQHKKRRFLPGAKQDGNENFGFFKRRRTGSMDNRGKRGVEKIVLPTKFLLGGNINDPLNLNSLNDEEVNRMLNEKTPQSSPLPVPARRQNVEVRIPVNMHDPLNLNGGEDSDDPIVKSFRKRKRHRPKKKDKDATLNSTGASDANLNSSKVTEKAPNARDALRQALKIDIDPPEEQQAAEEEAAEKSQNIFSSHAKLKKIVSPVICQGTKRARRRTVSECGVNNRLDVSRALFRRSSSPDAAKLRNVSVRKFRRQTSGSSLNKGKTGQEKSEPSPPKRFPKNPQFVNGNYNRYYGYRNPNMEVDDRLRKFQREWFEGKDVLDIGCNVGHVTLAIARDFNPRRIVGIDIDHNLIRSARNNIRNFLSSMHDSGRYPASSTISYGPIEAPPLVDSSTRFPRNVMFMQGNYVLEKDEQLEMVHEEYDAILALSITKWIHLNNGDAGLKRTFHRMFRQLRPGGRLILEPQPWASYRKRKKLTETIYKNYHSIELRPEMFRQYLLSEVGFAKCEPIDVPFNKSKGFRRPLLLFTKFDTQYNSPAPGLFATPIGTPRFSRLATATVISSTADDRSCASYTPSMCSTCVSCSSSCSSSPCSSCTSLQTRDQEAAGDEVSYSSYTDASQSQVDYGEVSVSSYGDLSQMASQRQEEDGGGEYEAGGSGDAGFVGRFSDYGDVEESASGWTAREENMVSDDFNPLTSHGDAGEDVLGQDNKANEEDLVTCAGDFKVPHLKQTADASAKTADIQVTSGDSRPEDQETEPLKSELFADSTDFEYSTFSAADSYSAEVGSTVADGEPTEQLDSPYSADKDNFISDLPNAVVDHVHDNTDSPQAVLFNTEDFVAASGDDPETTVENPEEAIEEADSFLGAEEDGV